VTKYLDIRPLAKLLRKIRRKRSMKLSPKIQAWLRQHMKMENKP
jgi:hypothetical protein